MHKDQPDALPVIDMLDLLKQQVVAGKPLVEIKPSNMDAETSSALDKTHNSLRAKLAEETGLPVKVVQIVNLPAVK